MAAFTNLPVDLVIVRHGQSEANMMIEMTKRGDSSATEAMKAAVSASAISTEPNGHQSSDHGTARFPAPRPGPALVRRASFRRVPRPISLAR